MLRRQRRLLPVLPVLAALLLLTAAPATAPAGVAAAATPAAGPASPAPAATPVLPAVDLLAGSGVTLQDGWYVVRLAGTPYQIGYQRGFLTPQLADYWIRSYLGPAGGGYRELSRTVARRVVWPRVPAWLQEELRGEAAGLKAAVDAAGPGFDDRAGLRGQSLADTLWDVVAANDWADQYVYQTLLKGRAKKEAAAVLAAQAPRPAAATGGRCSAFIASGDATADGDVVMGHNTWWLYNEDFMNDVIYDVHPLAGHSFRYQGAAGAVWSGEDWYVNDAGLMVTETSLESPAFDAAGSPVFVRIRTAVQFTDSIDGFLDVMLSDNNGAYPNEWLVGDARTGEIASLQLGCEKFDLVRTFDGFLTSCNYAWGEEFQSEAGRSKPQLKSYDYARYVRWAQLRPAWYGHVDAEAGKALLSDTWDVYLGREGGSSRTICGEWENEPIGQAWPEGAYDGKVTTGAMVLDGMRMWARWGHPNGDPFDAEAYMAANRWWVATHSDFDVLGLRLFDAMTPQPWTLIE